MLLLNKYYVWKNETTGTHNGIGWQKAKRYVKIGASDILGILPGGRFLAIEVKANYNNPTEEQQLFIDDINKKGGLAFVAKSRQDVIDRFREEGYDIKRIA